MALSGQSFACSLAAFKALRQFQCCRECVRLIKELDAPVEFIVFPTFAYGMLAQSCLFSDTYDIKRLLPGIHVHLSSSSQCQSLPCAEHKIFVGPFSRKFPKAQVWIAPRQELVQSGLLYPGSLGLAELGRGKCDQA